MVVLSGSALACNPNKSCSACLLHNPFGGCIQHGNDPFCEGRKAACRACLSADLVKMGADAQCAACIVGALYTGGAIAEVCAASCGGAIAAEEYARVSGC